MPTRRDFVQLATTAAAIGAAPNTAVTRIGAPGFLRRRGSGLRILILGGTGFTGPFHVAYAAARGHQVTVFNRNRRQTDLPAGVERLQGDRVTGDLASLNGKSWDVVIDIPNSLPRWIRDAAQVLAKAAPRFIFISTISVYGDPAEPPAENAPVDAWKKNTDPMDIRQLTAPHFEDYGALKALAEKEAERWWPGKTTIIRPGLIVGPRDDFDRFTYWATRVERGGEVLAPGNPTDPAQIIDGRDLSEWVIRMAEAGTPGAFNATGPRARLSFGEMLYGMRAAVSGDTEIRFTWVPADFLAQEKAAPWSDLPLWMPPGSASQHVLNVKVERAVAAGLTYRPLAETVRDTLAWFKTLPEQRRTKLRAGLTAEREAQILTAWRAKAGG